MITDVYEYNQHFVAMMNVINAARLNPPAKGHNHHIIPKCWFKKNNLPVDNSKDNIVLLSPEEHMKAHKLAALCIIGSEMRSAMGFAVHRLHGEFGGLKHSDATKLKMSNSRKGIRPKNLDSLHESQVGRQMPLSVRMKISDTKRKRMTDDIKMKISKSHKGMKWKIIDGKRTWYKEEI